MEALYCTYISQHLSGGFVLHLLLLDPSVKALYYTLSVSPSVEALYCTFYQSAPLIEALYCASYQFAPPWRLYTALYVSWPLSGRGGFILHFLLLSPAMEASYLLAGPWRPHTSLFISRPLCGGLTLRFHQSASVEALYCIV